MRNMDPYPSTACGDCARRQIHNLAESGLEKSHGRTADRVGALFWVSLGCWYVGGAKEKLPIWELWGSSRRAAAGSLDMAAAGGFRCALWHGGVKPRAQQLVARSLMQFGWTERVGALRVSDAVDGDGSCYVVSVDAGRTRACGKWWDTAKGDEGELGPPPNAHARQTFSQI